MSSKSKNVTIRLTERELEEIREIADKLDRSVSGFVRDAVIEKKAREELKEELRNSG